MAGPRRNGVDAAIALLLALVAHGGEASAALLRREIGAPRASFHRIVRTLSAAGIVEAPRGRVRVGPFAETLLRAHSDAVRRDDELRASRSVKPYRQPLVSRTAEASATGLIGLSRPRSARRAARFRIGFSNASMNNLWRVALVHGVEYAAAHLGDRIERLTILHAGDDARQQQADIAEMIASGVDGLIVSAVAPQMTADAIHQAMARGIAVVLVDRGIEASVPRTSFVTSDDGAIGRLTALWLAERLEGKGSILLLAGDGAAGPARMRLAAAESVFREFPGIEVLATEWTGWRREVGREMVRSAIERWGTRIAGVWCDSGLQGAGSLQAFGEARWRAGEIPPHTGGDLNLAYKLAIRLGAPLAAVDYPPSMGIKALEVLLTSLQGSWTPSSVNVASEVIVSKGAATPSVTPDHWAEDHVRWDLPDDLILASGLGPAYNPRSFRIHYPGNVYNRSAARAAPRAPA
jgi:ABC-type sugar transport system substrate-binding protein